MISPNILLIFSLLSVFLQNHASLEELFDKVSLKGENSTAQNGDSKNDNKEEEGRNVTISVYEGNKTVETEHIDQKTVGVTGAAQNSNFGNDSITTNQKSQSAQETDIVNDYKDSDSNSTTTTAIDDNELPSGNKTNTTNNNTTSETYNAAPENHNYNLGNGTVTTNQKIQSAEKTDIKNKHKEYNDEDDDDDYDDDYDFYYDDDDEDDYDNDYYDDYVYYD